MVKVVAWDIGFKRINVIVDSLHQDKSQAPNTGSFFSGGVDSFYTYLKHKTDQKKSDRIDSLILVNGFEIDLRSKALWKLTYDNISAIAEAENVELVTVESNLYKMIDPILAWDFSHGGALAAIGLFLRGQFRKIYIPSTFGVDEQIPWGSHLDLDNHWSTESLEFSHDGVEAKRVEKVTWQVAKSPVALKHLRVCYMNTIGTYNCGVCAKCIRTMINLYLAGALEKTATFPHELDIDLIASTPSPVTDGNEQIFVGEEQNLEMLRAKGLNPQLQAAIIASMKKTMAMREDPAYARQARLSKLVKQGIYLDHAYSHGYFYELLSRLFGRKFA
jgi:hypothetical protein